jgi:hypothetical protein
MHEQVIRSRTHPTNRDPAVGRPSRPSLTSTATSVVAVPLTCAVDGHSPT